MSDDRDIAAELDDIAEQIECGESWLIPGPIRAAAAEIRRLRAELDLAHTQMDKAGIPRDWGSAPLELGQRINLKLQAMADMIEARDESIVVARIVGLGPGPVIVSSSMAYAMSGRSPGFGIETRVFGGKLDGHAEAARFDGFPAAAGRGPIVAAHAAVVARVYAAYSTTEDAR